MFYKTCHPLVIYTDRETLTYLGDSVSNCSGFGSTLGLEVFVQDQNESPWKITDNQIKFFFEITV